MLSALTLLVIVTARPQETQAEPPQAPPVESRVTSAALFKNGLAFVRRAARVEGDATSVRLADLPVPAHGTFWITTAPADVRLESAVARRAEIREASPATTVAELLRANVGRRLTMVLLDGSTLQGLINAMPEPAPEVRPTPSPYWGPVYPPPTSPGQLLLLETDSGMVALSASDVRRVVAETGSLKREIERTREGVSLTLALERGAGAGAAEIELLYLAHGLTWAPSYAIDVSDPEKALLTAKAEVIDEVEDLAGAALQLVTGFPNLQFSHVADPIAMQGDLNAFLSALGQSPTGGTAVVAQQAVLSNVAMRSGEASFPVAGAPGEGAAVEDLFFYDVADVTLARGERGLYPLFTVRVPYQHLYEWKIADTIDGRVSRPRDEPAEEEIWHSLRLTNDSSLPWTTAPAMTMKDGHLLGQDTLSYTAVGAKTTVRITRAVDVQGEATEYEIARDRGGASFYGRRYDKVTVEGQLRATNHKREAVRLEITKRIQGEVTKNPNGATVVAVAEGLRAINPSTRLTWSVPLDPGQTAEIGYTYTLYVNP